MDMKPQSVVTIAGAVAAAEGLLTEAALKHACTEPLVLAQKSGCYASAEVFAPKPPSACHRLELRSLSRRPVAPELRGWPVPLVKRPRAERHSYDQSAANRCSSTPTPKRKPS
jgi:hypothetical protein